LGDLDPSADSKAEKPDSSRIKLVNSTVELSEMAEIA
jgi:hypothetical protein